MMYLSSGLLCLTLLSLKRSAATCTLHKLSSLLQARIINLYSRQRSVSIFHLSLCPPQGFDFREFLFTKLINAEYACYKAEKFAKLEVRATQKCECLLRLCMHISALNMLVCLACIMLTHLSTEFNFKCQYHLFHQIYHNCVEQQSPRKRSQACVSVMLMYCFKNSSPQNNGNSVCNHTHNQMKFLCRQIISQTFWEKNDAELN